MSCRPFAAAKICPIEPNREFSGKTLNGFTDGSDLKLGLLAGLLLAVSAIIFAPDPSDAAESSGLRKVRMAFTSLSSVMCPPWIAREAGIFNKHGLDVEVIAT